MRINLIRFLVFWGVTALSLWVADELFDGIAFQTSQSLFIAGLLLGIVNTVGQGCLGSYSRLSVGTVREFVT